MRKRRAIRTFARHVSSGKAAFYTRYLMRFVMGERSGPWLHDIRGRKHLINLHCNGGVFNLGHRNPHLVGVLKKALDEVDIGNHHLLSAERAAAADAITRSMPDPLTHVIFGSGGGEAVDTAIKVARGQTARREIVSFHGGYHGHTGLALATGDPKYREPFLSSLPDFSQIPPFDLEALRTAVTERTAALIVETVPATLGMVIPPPEFLAQAAAHCRSVGALLIVDEVQSGLGRTGRLWGFEHFGVVPDIVVLGKGLSGGLYPISATVVTAQTDALFRDDPFLHISTFGGSELGCRVARTVLETVADERFLQGVTERADAFASLLARLRERHAGYLTGIRQLGLMIGLEFPGTRDGLLVSRAAYANGLLMVYANNDPRVVQMLPPLNIPFELLPEIERRLQRTFTMARRLSRLVGVGGADE